MQVRINNLGNDAGRLIAETVKPVSIGMPVYNSAHFIREALDSLLNQTFTDFELIISDNASTDDTESICREYTKKDKRIRYFRQAVHRNVYSNYQFVLDEAIGEYYMWAAADDIKSDNFIEENYLFLQANQDYVASISPVRFQGEDFDELRMGDLSLDGQTFDDRLLKFFVKWHSNGRFYSLIRRSALSKLTIDGEDYLGNDWIIVINLLSQGKMKRISKGYVVLGKNGESSTTNVFDKYNNKNFLYFIFPFKDLITYLNLKYPHSVAKNRTHLYLRWMKLGCLALILNIKYSMFGRKHN